MTVDTAKGDTALTDQEGPFQQSIQKLIYLTYKIDGSFWLQFKQKLDHL